MEAPQNVTELRRFLGMANQLGKFSKDLAEITQPLRVLLSNKQSWNWGPPQDQAFAKVKDELTKPTVLTPYDPEAATKISADASSYGIGAVLLQTKNDSWQPVAYASRTMTETECCYAQIEKEALAIVWACEKFSTYVIGKEICLETDHKPLVPLLGTKDLDNLPPRILRFRLRLARFSYSIGYVPGKNLYTANTLSRSPISDTVNELQLEEEETELLVQMQIDNLPASKGRLEEYHLAQAVDPTCSKVSNYSKNGWPNKGDIDPDIKQYWQEQGNLTIHDNLLLYSGRVVVPKALQKITLAKIHQGHQGIQRCRLRAKMSVWWPGISKDIEEFVKRCPVCVKNSVPRHEPLLTTKLPDYPWQRVGTDLFQLNGDNYILVADYYSRYPEVIKLNSTTSSSVIKALKSVFSRYGIPETVCSDNGPQYSSQEFADFAITYNFSHVTSSPYFPQSNGHAERAVQTAKELLKESKDPFMSLLIYRTTPLPWCNLSPAELLMGRQLRSNLPVMEKNLIPNWTYLEKFKETDKEFKRKQKRDYDRHHRVKTLPHIPENTSVWVTTDGKRIPGQVVAHAEEPRSYLVETSGGVLRRNRHHLNPVPEDYSNPDSEPLHTQDQDNSATDKEQFQQSPPRVIMTRTRTGTTIRPPDRLTGLRKGDVA
jgi:transposase InsO family protein